MKKLLTILLSILLIFAAGCTLQEELQIPLVEVDSSTEVNDTAASSVEVDAERPMPLYSSVEELTAAVQAERQAKTKSSLARSGDLETLSVTYAPANEIDGFQLCMIEVCPDKVFYMYEHEGKEMPYFEWTKGIIFTVYRDPSYTLASFCDQYDMIPDEEGFAYDSKMGEVYFIQEDTVISVLVPEHMNDYDTIRSLCEMEKIEIP